MNEAPSSRLMNDSLSDEELMLYVRNGVGEMLAVLFDRYQVPLFNFFYRLTDNRAIPLIGVGLFYGQGYFRQRLDQNGWQYEEYLQTDISQLPMEPAIGRNGEPVLVQIETLKTLHERFGHGEILGRRYKVARAEPGFRAGIQPA